MAASGLKWISATMGTSQPAAMSSGLDVLEIGGVLDGGRGDADDFAADLDQVEGLLDAFAGIHGVAGEHRLDADGIGAADADIAHADPRGKYGAGSGTDYGSKGRGT